MPDRTATQFSHVKPGDTEFVDGVALLAGRWDILACIAQPWDTGSGVILEQVHAIPGVLSTSTLVSIAFDEGEEDRDQFSAWS